MMKSALLAAAAALLLGGLGNAEPLSLNLLTFKATQAGRQTLDEGEGGGNPFASALIKALFEERQLSELPSRIRELTSRLSEGFQQADVPLGAVPADLRIAGEPIGQSRVALVVVYSDYSAAPGLPSLPGAARDATRIANALTRAGYATQVVIDPSRETLSRTLQDFAAGSARAGVALLYTTGHGVEVNGVGYLIPNDYPVLEGSEALEKRAMPLTRLASSMHARSANLFFYGGCRDNPFAG